MPTLDPLLVSIIAVSFSLLLLLASVHKFSDLRRFEAVLNDYRALPAALVPAFAVILPALEAAIGLAWLFASAAISPAIATVSLLSVYTLGIVINLMRGRLHISCGCGFGNASGDGESLSWALVLRNTILVGFASLALLPVTQRDFGFLDYITLLSAVITIALLFAAASQLLRNRGAISLWRDAPRGRH